MCSVIGYHPVEPRSETVWAFNQLFMESRIRGLHAFGIAQPSEHGGVDVLKSFQAEEIPFFFNPHRPAIAHTRYSQSGDWHVMANNQPLVVGTTAVAMNGVLHMGTKDEFEAAFGVCCVADNDSEIFLQRLALGQPAHEFLEEITGSCAMTWLEGGRLFAARNPRRPLWRAEQFGGIWFASTENIFRRAGFSNVTEVIPYTVQEFGR